MYINIRLIKVLLLTTSHKYIGILYGYMGYIGGVLGYFFSMLMRMELNNSGLSIMRKVKEVSIYNNWITVHGLVMIFVFIMPVSFGYYGNYLVPMMIGTSELSMPRMNGISFWSLIVGVVIFVVSNVIISKPISSGWTIYPPLSTRDADNVGINIDMSLLVVHVLGLSSTLGSINFITTNKYNRHVGLVLLGISIYNFSVIVTAVLLIGSLPILGVAITGLLLDRNINSNIYDSTGDPVLYQHLFWFFGHPEVYIIILPIFGLTSLILTSIVHKDIFGREGMIYCLISIGVVGYFVWAHHMFTVGLDIDSRAYFSIATSIISIPTSVKIFSYINTWASGKGHKGSNSSWCFFSFLICFTFGGFTGLLLSSAHLDIILHDTYFVVGHFHTVLSLASAFGLLIAHYFFLPILFSISILESYSFYHTYLLLIGALLIFYPMHLAGISGMARRYPEYSDYFLPFLTVSTHGTFIVFFSTVALFRSFYHFLSLNIYSSFQSYSSKAILSQFTHISFSISAHADFFFPFFISKILKDFFDDDFMVRTGLFVMSVIARFGKTMTPQGSNTSFLIHPSLEAQGVEEDGATVVGFFFFPGVFRDPGFYFVPARPNQASPRAGQGRAALVQLCCGRSGARGHPPRAPSWSHSRHSQAVLRPGRHLLSIVGAGAP